MEMTPDAFERQVSRIHELLERSGCCVTWNDHIPDPDNPKQVRQIDVTIRRGEVFTVIECRLSRKRQNVKWIEELMGRRQSLGAQAIIGVASAGFTMGAQRKADRFGVVLRDLRTLTDNEVAEWGQQVSLTLYYYQYSHVTLSIGFSPKSIQNVDVNELSTELRSHRLVQAAFTAAATLLGERNLFARQDTTLHRFGVRLQPDNASGRVCDEQVLELSLEGSVRLVGRPLSSPTTVRYGPPVQPSVKRCVTVQQFDFGETSIVHDAERIAIEIDLSREKLPPLSQARFIRASSANELEHESFAITDATALRVLGPFKVVVYTID
jgi:Restriction endonuclease